MNSVLFRFINSDLKSDFLDFWMPIFSDKDFIVLPGLIAAILAALFGGRRARLTVFALILAILCADNGSEKIIKPTIGAPRPYQVMEDTNLHRNNDWMVYNPAWYGTIDRRISYGFPSSHASNMAAVAVVLATATPYTLIVTAPLALLVGLSRVYTGNHFPFQVLAGFFWGALCAAAAVWLVRALARRYYPEPARVEPPQPVPRERYIFYWLLGAWAAFNLIYIQLNLFDLAGDVAQYWDWSRRLDLGYYSKPPLIAYWIAFLTSSAGNKEWVIRTGAVMLSCGTLACLYGLTRRTARSDAAALWAVLAALAMPATWAGAFVMTIDPLLLFFWALALYAFQRAVRGERSLWWLAGLAIGLGMLAKYTMAILALAFAAYLLLFDRRWLKRREPYIALVIALLCMSGVLYWNAAHDWISFRHTAAIGAAEEGARPLAWAAEFFAGQAGIVSPILFGFMLWAWGVCVFLARRNKDAALLALAFGALFWFYALVALFRAPHANWPAPAYIAGAAAFGWIWTRRDRSAWTQRLLVTGVVVGAAIGVFARSTELLYVLGRPPLPGESAERLHLFGADIDPDMDPTNKLIGGEELTAALDPYIGALHGDPFLFSNSYQDTARLAFYAPGQPRAYCLRFNRRMNQYDLWGGWEELAGRDAIFVTGGDAERGQAWVDGIVGMGLFEGGRLLETIEVVRGHTIVKTYTISRFRNYSGLPMQLGHDY